MGIAFCWFNNFVGAFCNVTIEKKNKEKIINPLGKSVAALMCF